MARYKDFEDCPDIQLITHDNKCRFCKNGKVDLIDGKDDKTYTKSSKEWKARDKERKDKQQ